MQTIGRALLRARTISPMGDIGDIIAKTLTAQGDIHAHPHNHSAEPTQLDENALRASRVVAFEPKLPPTRHYDILRNQLASHRRHASPHVVAVVSPGNSCGTTTTAINLAWSFARNRSHRVTLVDTNDKKPDVLQKLGLESAERQAAFPAGSFDVVQVRDIAMRVAIAGNSLDASDVISRLPRLGNASDVIVIDLPPLLLSDRSAAYLALAQSVVVVLCEGQTTLAEVESCKTFLGDRPGVQFTLNKCGRHGL